MLEVHTVLEANACGAATRRAASVEEGETGLGSDLHM